MKRVLSTMLIIALTIPLLVNCKKEKAEEVAIVSITIEPTSFVINAGETKQLTVTALPENATKKEKILSSLVWHSDNEEVASVDENGMVTAKKYGTTTISASIPDGFVTGSCDITVNQDITDKFDYVLAAALEYKDLIEDSDKIMYAEVTKITSFSMPKTYKERLESCKGLEFLTNLEYLYLTDCKNLKTLDVSKLTKLQNLIADGCQLANITFGKHDNMVYISLIENKLKKFDGSIFPNLTNLYLSDNELTEINLKGCSKLTALQLINNKLKSIDITDAVDMNANQFFYWNNPGENRVLKIINSNTTAKSISWLMTPGNESSRVQGMYYCEKAPKIKTQPKNVSAKDGVPFSLSVELDPVLENATYTWCVAQILTNPENGIQSVTYFGLEKDVDESDEKGKYIISGTSSPTLTMTVSGQYYKKMGKEVALLVYITDPATKTITISSHATVTFAGN
ncbi:MAG: Ig-like domain-containing protein [Bacteroidales bacterium]|nr:Ig-like domain-containing protein [Bacteroidales bacterium]